MKARIKATGKIVEVKVYKREHRLYIRIDGEKTGEIYRAKDLDFNIEGKFAETCLNGIKQGIDYTPDYWTRFEHQAAIAAMQGILSNPNIVHKDISTETICNHVAERVKEIAHALVEKMKEERK